METPVVSWKINENICNSLLLKKIDLFALLN